VKTQVKVRELETLSDPECQDLGLFGEDYFPARPRNNLENYNAKQHLAWALSLFRMRVHMIQDLSALIVFGGKDDGQSWGRFSGIAEEIMLALAMKKPVYVMGTAGGAGLAVGKLLGLDETLVNPDTCLADIGSIEHSPLYKHYKHAFVLPEQPNLPRTVAEVRNYLFEHGVTSSAWPWNGLTPEQNRQLFNTELAQEDAPKENKRSCISLIIEGLTRLDWKKQSPNSQEPRAMGKARPA
jgi:SLOG-like protein